MQKFQVLNLIIIVRNDSLSEYGACILPHSHVSNTFDTFSKDYFILKWTGLNTCYITFVAKKLVEHTFRSIE